MMIVTSRQLSTEDRAEAAGQEKAMLTWLGTGK